MNKLHSTGAASNAPTAHAYFRGARPRTPKDVLHRISTRIHRAVFRASKGRVLGKAFGMPIAELLTTGRRSGKERSTMLAVPIIEGDRLVLVASFGGDDRNPEWYLTSGPSRR